MKTKIIFKGDTPNIANVGDTDSIIISGNLYHSNTDKYIPYNYFLDYPPFINGFDNSKLDLIHGFKLDKKILCYNRRPRSHRLVLLYHLLINPNIKNNSLISLGNKTNSFKHSRIADINDLINDEYLSKCIDEYFKNIPTDIGFSTYSLEPNLGTSFLLEEYNKTFISLVTETNINKDILFISEKTYKPIFAQQPFIIMGNPNTLEYLRSIGFKTFGDWWDESYDNELDFKKRMYKIINIVESLCSKSLDELTQIRIDMKDILIHNYKLFITLEAADDRLKKLGYGKKYKPNKLI